MPRKGIFEKTLKNECSWSKINFCYELHNAKIVKLVKLAQIENSEPPVPPDSKNTQFVSFGPKLWKFTQEQSFNSKACKKLNSITA